MAQSAVNDKIKEQQHDNAMDWFHEGSWKKDFSVSPDKSLDVNAFYLHYDTHKFLWDKAFCFLQDTKLDELKTGRYPIIGDTLFVMVQEYQTQDRRERNYEAHRKYIDLQYVISGEELIGVSALNRVSLTREYDAGKDIAFYETEEGEFRVATNDVFFIFFPEDAHMPCIKKGKDCIVKKIVLKILINLK